MGALQDSFIASARRQPQATAVVEPGKGSITYGDLNVLSDRLRDRLASLGVGPGDRVGFYVRKSIDSTKLRWLWRMITNTCRALIAISHAPPLPGRRVFGWS